MRLCFCEDSTALALDDLPAAWPVGLGVVADAAVRYFGAEAVGHLVRPARLAAGAPFTPPGPVNNPTWLRAGPTVLVNTRWLTGERAAPPELLAGGPRVALCGGRFAYAVLSPEWLMGLRPTTLDDCLADWSKRLPLAEAGGQLVESRADLPAANARQIALGARGRPRTTHHPASLTRLGPRRRLHLDPRAAVEPFLVVSVERGPVILEAGVVVEAFTRIEGPCYVGAGARLERADLRAGTTIGAGCVVRGRVGASILGRNVVQEVGGVIVDSFVGDGVQLAAGAHLTGAVVAADAPALRLRAG